MYLLQSHSLLQFLILCNLLKKLNKKNLKCFYTTHIHYRTVNIDNYILQLSNV
jgi:hypothetical protein